MARRERTKVQHDLLYERWTIFGEWITHQRLIVGFTQQQAATAVGVSRRQWIRYELGAKVPVKRMKAMAPVLHVTEERMLDRAGYKVSYKRHAAREHVGRILDSVCAGKLDIAIRQLSLLNDRIRGIKAARGPRAGGLTATDYCNALVVLNDLPQPWVENLQQVMQERIKDKTNQHEFYLHGQRLIRKKREDRIIWPEPLALCWLCRESVVKEPNTLARPNLSEQ